MAAPELLTPVVFLLRIIRLGRFTPIPTHPSSTMYRRLWAPQALPMAMHHKRGPVLWAVIQTARSRTLPKFEQMAHGPTHRQGRMDLCLFKHSSNHTSIGQPLH